MSGMILTMEHRVRNAIRFRNEESTKTWLLFGKSSAWLDDNNPPNPDVDITTVEGVILARKATVSWVVQDPDGSYTFTSPPLYQGGPNVVTTWAELATEQDAVTASCRWCLVQGEIEGSILSSEFRIVAFVTNLTPATGHENDSYVLAANIEDIGNIETIVYKRPTTLSNTGVYTMSNIIEF